MPIPVKTTKSHPFINGLKKVPENRNKELQKVRAWLNTQPHLPEISDEFIYLFLHASFYGVDRAKTFIENYFTIRTNTPLLFAERNVFDPKMQALLEVAHMARLPKTTPEGYKVLLFSLRNTDPSKLVFNDAVKGFCMYSDFVLSEDGLPEGYIIVFDMKGVCIGHLARVSLPALRAFFLYVQEAHPARLKSVHVLNTASWIHHIMRIVVPMVKHDMLSLVKFHKGNLPEGGVPLELMPMDYGGEAPSVQELSEEVRFVLEKYAVYMRETELFRVDESKRTKKASWWNYLTGSSSKSTTMDEKSFLKTLQID